MPENIRWQHDPFDRKVGSRIRGRRRALKLSQQDVATSLGISYQQLQKYEWGTNRVSASSLVAIARALGVAPSYFFDGFRPRKDGAPPSDDLVRFVASDEGMQLNQSFKGIKSAYVRNLVVALVQSIAARD